MSRTGYKLAPRRKRLTLLGAGECGEATVEFIGLMVVIVVPVLYLILCLAQVQASVLASEAASREAVRILAENPEDEDLARIQVDLAFADFGIDSGFSVSFGCDTCSGLKRDVRVSVQSAVPLPLIPAWISDRVSFPVSSTATSRVEGVSLK